MINIEKFYNIAKAMVGDLNRDLVHHCFLLYSEKQNDINTNHEGYFYRIMLSQLGKGSKFRKAYNTLHIPYYPEEFICDIDTQAVERIIEELKAEGYEIEVQAFIDINTNTNYTELSNMTKVRRDTLYKICNFVKSEIAKRYEHNHNEPIYSNSVNSGN